MEQCRKRKNHIKDYRNNKEKDGRVKKNKKSYFLMKNVKEEETSQFKKIIKKITVIKEIE